MNASTSKPLGVPFLQPLVILSSEAGRNAYLGAFHAVRAFIFDPTGKVVRGHQGVHREFTRLAANQPEIDKSFPPFLTRAYNMREIADYDTAPCSFVSPEYAATAIETATRFVQGKSRKFPFRMDADVSRNGCSAAFPVGTVTIYHGHRVPAATPCPFPSVFLHHHRLVRWRLPLVESEFACLGRVIEARRWKNGFLLTAWVFLPDHWYAVLSPRNPVTISRVLEAVKVSSTPRINSARGGEGLLWQGRFFDRALRTEGDYHEKVEDSHRNLMKAGLVTRGRRLGLVKRARMHRYGEGAGQLASGLARRPRAFVRR